MVSLPILCWRFLLSRNHGHGNGQVLLSNNKSDGRVRMIDGMVSTSQTEMGGRLFLIFFWLLDFCFCISFPVYAIVGFNRFKQIIYFVFFFFVFWGEHRARTRAILSKFSTLPTSPNNALPFQTISHCSIGDDCPDPHDQSFLTRPDNGIQHTIFMICVAVAYAIVCESFSVFLSFFLPFLALFSLFPILKWV